MDYPKVCLRRGEEAGVLKGQKLIYDNELDWADDICIDGCISPLPMLMDARGAPPEATSAAKADTIRMIGVQTPRPVRARLPTCGMWPM